MSKVVVQTRGKDFVTNENILRKSKYFQNMFNDLGVVTTIPVDISCYAFKHILKHLENNLYIIPPEYYQEQDFLMLDFIEDKLVVMTDTSYHYLDAKFLNFFLQVFRNGKLINLSSITDEVFQVLKAYLLFGIRPKKSEHVKVFEAYGITFGYDSCVYYTYEAKLLISTYETQKIFNNYGMKSKVIKGSPECFEQARNLFNKLNKGIKVNDLDKQSREFFNKIIADNK
jgi:hypothetical protein